MREYDKEFVFRRSSLGASHNLADKNLLLPLVARLIKEIKRPFYILSMERLKVRIVAVHGFLERFPLPFPGAKLDKG